MPEKAHAPACLPWRAFDAAGDFVGLVLARNAFEALRSLPAGSSVYLGGPSPTNPERPWWTDAWKTGNVSPDDLLAHDPR